jgi:hypothetical protein
MTSSSITNICTVHVMDDVAIPSPSPTGRGERKGPHNQCDSLLGFQGFRLAPQLLEGLKG